MSVILFFTMIGESRTAVKEMDGAAVFKSVAKQKLLHWMIVVVCVGAEIVAYRPAKINDVGPGIAHDSG